MQRWGFPAPRPCRYTTNPGRAEDKCRGRHLLASTQPRLAIFQHHLQLGGFEPYPAGTFINRCLVGDTQKVVLPTSYTAITLATMVGRGPLGTPRSYYNPLARVFQNKALPTDIPISPSVDQTQQAREGLEFQSQARRVKDGVAAPPSRPSIVPKLKRAGAG